MKKVILFLFAIISLVDPISADGWTPSPVGEGDFYLYNVGGDAFIKGGNNYGTRITLSTQEAVRVTLTASGTGYTMSSTTYGGLYLGSDGYIDKSTAYVWDFTPIDSLQNTYLLSTDGSYIYGRSDTKTSVSTTRTNTNYDHWQLISRADMIAQLEKATSNAPMDATFLIDNPNFGFNTDASLWNSPSLGGWYSSSGGSYNAEKWNTTFNCYQTINDLPDGDYRLYIQGFYRVGNNSNNAAAAAAARQQNTEALNAVFYANNYTKQIPSIFSSARTTYNSTYNSSTGYTINDTTWYVPTTQSRAAYCFEDGDYTDSLNFTVIDGSVTIGVQNQVVDSCQWCCWDNFRLTYYGETQDLSTYVQRIETLIAQAATLQDSVPAGAYSALSDTIDTYNKTYTSINEYTNAITIIQEAINTTKELITPYLAFNNILTTTTKIATQEVYTDTNGAKDTFNQTVTNAKASIEQVLTAEEIENLTAEVKTALMTLISTVDINSGMHFDLTDFITNADMASSDGWTTTVTPTIGTDVAEYYQTTFNINQTITNLAPGNYRLNVKAFERPSTNATTYSNYTAGTNNVSTVVYINTDSLPILNIMADRSDTLIRTGDYTCQDSTYTPNTLNGAADYFAAGHYHNDIETTIVNGTLTFGLNCQKTDSYHWVAFTDFSLYYLGSTDDDLELYLTTLQEIINEAQTLALDDTYPGNEIETLTEAIAAAQKNLTATDINTISTSIQNLEQAVTDYKEANACWEHPVSINIENPTMDNGATMSFPGWTLVNGSTSAGYWDTNTTDSYVGFTTNFMECWVAASSTTLPNNTASQIVTLPSSGYYQLSAAVIAVNQNNVNTTTTGVQLFMDNDATNCSSGNGKPAIFSIGATKQPGQCTIGLRTTSTTANWVAWDNVVLYYYGDETAYMIHKLQELNDSLAILHDELNGLIPTALTQLLKQGIEPTGNTAQDYTQAVQSAQTLIEEAHACIETYSTVNNLYTQVQAISNVTDYTETTQGAHQTLVNRLSQTAQAIESSTSADSLTTTYNNLFNAAYTYIASATPTGSARFDITFLLTNPDLTGFTTWAAADGWNTDMTTGNCQVMTNSTVTADDNYTYFYEYWSTTAQEEGFLVYQYPTLPAGAYTVTCHAFATDDDDQLCTPYISLSAGDLDGTMVRNSTLTQVETSFNVTEEDNIKIGLKAHTDNQANWVGLGYMNLYKVNRASVVLNEYETYDERTTKNIDVDLLKTINKDCWNAICLPVDVNNQSLRQAFGNDVEIAYLYTCYTQGDETILDFEKADIGIVANVPALVRITTPTDSVTFTRATFTNGTPQTNIGDYTFIGNYNGPQTPPENTFVVDGETFRPATQTDTINSYGAYIQAPTDTSATTLTIIIDGVATTIPLTTQTKQTNKQNTVFDLSGRRYPSTTNLTPGIYIINNNKVIIK